MIVHTEEMRPQTELAAERAQFEWSWSPSSDLPGSWDPWNEWDPWVPWDPRVPMVEPIIFAVEPIEERERHGMVAPYPTMVEVGPLARVAPGCGAGEHVLSDDSWFGLDSGGCACHCVHCGYTWSHTMY